VKSLGADDKEGIAQTINQEVLKGTPITFKSTAVRPDADDRLHVTGDLELANGVNLIAFDITVSDDGRVTGTASVKQTEWGMKPYSALFGTLKVTDDVGVDIEAKLRPVG
jgi:polyisoprenoid-binding protein YceI